MYTAEEYKIIGTLKSLGIHITRCRIAVFKMFYHHNEALPTSYINKYFSGSIDRISVYRALKTFIQKGILLRIPNTEGEIRYMLSHNKKDGSAIGKTQLAYLVCTSCEKMKLLDESVFQQFTLPENLCVKHCHVLLEGVCTKCEGGLHI